MPANEHDPEPTGQSLPAGARLEEFVIEKVLGSGGFGITYLAKDTSLGRRVVIKENLPAQFAWRETVTGTVRPRHTSGGDADDFAWSMKNFLREAETLASLDHPGIVRVLRKFEANGTAYFIMPFVEGVAFDALIDSNKAKDRSFDEAGLHGLLTRMLDTLGYLHDRGVYHRDIKPANILITSEGIPVLIDFGSARQRLSDRSMTVVESAGYTPFEQLQSRGNVGPWSDLYALGGTLAKAITGEAPPKAMDRMRRDPMVLLALRGDLVERFSATFLASIDTALAVEETERWQDAGEWQTALRGRPATVAQVTSVPVSLPTPKQQVLTAAPRPAAPVVHLPDPGKAQRSQTQRTPGTQRIDSIVSAKKINPLPWIIAACVILVLGAGAMFHHDSKEPVTNSTLAPDPTEVTSPLSPSIPRPKSPPSVIVPEVVSPPQKKSADVVAGKATKDQPFINSLEMKFVPVKITGGPSAGQQVLFSVWKARVQDYRKYAEATSGVDREWKNPGFAQGEDHPVVKVSWEDAVAFCEWLTQKERSTGKIPATAKYRLPTDHEWSCAVGIGEREDAAASPQSKDDKLGDVFPWGTQWPPPKGAGNYDTSLNIDEFKYTSPVDSFPANSSGLYDLGGNAWEWCEDLYSATSTARVLRGGSWNVFVRVVLRSACRDFVGPRCRYVSFGFRVVLVGGAG